MRTNRDYDRRQRGKYINYYSYDNNSAAGVEVDEGAFCHETKSRGRMR